MKKLAVISGHYPDKDPRISWQISVLRKKFIIKNICYSREERSEELESKLFFDVSIVQHIKFQLDLFEKLAQKKEFLVLFIYLLSIIFGPIEIIRRRVFKFNKKADSLRSDIGFINSTLELFTLLFIQLKTSSTCNAILKEQKFSSFLINDFPCLPLAFTLKKNNNKVYYDSHEYWPGIKNFSKSIKKIIFQIELALLSNTDLVSMIIEDVAKVYREAGLKNVCALNNAEPSEKYLATNLKNRDNRAEVIFIYQGGLGQGRGIDKIIKSWKNVDPSAHLIIRGPEGSSYEKLRKLIDEENLLNLTMMDPASPKRLVEELELADVGIIPYENLSENNNLACPNKFSQYLAAGLPVLVNNLKFLRELVEDKKIGYVFVDFETDFVKKVNMITKNHRELKELSANAKKFFVESFCWEIQSKQWFIEIEKIENQLK